MMRAVVMSGWTCAEARTGLYTRTPSRAELASKRNLKVTPNIQYMRLRLQYVPKSSV